MLCLKLSRQYRRKLIRLVTSIFQYFKFLKLVLSKLKITITRQSTFVGSIYTLIKQNIRHDVISVTSNSVNLHVLNNEIYFVQGRYYPVYLIFLWFVVVQRYIYYVMAKIFLLYEKIQACHKYIQSTHMKYFLFIMCQYWMNPFLL